MMLVIDTNYIFGTIAAATAISSLFIIVASMFISSKVERTLNDRFSKLEEEVNKTLLHARYAESRVVTAEQRVDSVAQEVRILALQSLMNTNTAEVKS